MRNTTKTQTEPNLPKAPIARTGVIQIFSCCWLKMGVGWGGESHSYSDGTFYSVFATKHREKIQKNIPPPPHQLPLFHQHTFLNMYCIWQTNNKKWTATLSLVILSNTDKNVTHAWVKVWRAAWPGSKGNWRLYQGSQFDGPVITKHCQYNLKTVPRYTKTVQ